MLNRASGSSRLLALTEAEIARAGHAVLNSVLGNRAAFAQAFAEGLGVTESAPRSLTARELRALLDEIGARTQ